MISRGVTTAMSLKCAWLPSILVVWSISSGCDSPTSTRTDRGTRVDPSWVVGAAAEAVDAGTGLFLLTPPSGAELGILQARSLARGYLKLTANEGPFGNSRAFAEQDRGGRINWDALQPCGRTYRVSTSLGALPQYVPREYHRLTASQWVVAFCSAGIAELSISVSDAPMSVSVVGDSLVWEDPDSLRGVFTFTGVPPTFPSGIPLTPEDAVQSAFAQTGTRISEAPEAIDQLESSGVGQLPLCGSWRLVFERPVRVAPVGGGQVELVEELFARHEPACFSRTIAFYAASTPPTATAWVRYVSGYGSAARIDSVSVNGVGPLTFHRVTIVQ